VSTPKTPSSRPSGRKRHQPAGSQVVSVPLGGRPNSRTTVLAVRAAGGTAAVAFTRGPGARASAGAVGTTGTHASDPAAAHGTHHRTHKADGGDSSATNTITHTVEHVVQVIPRPLRLALGGLLGLVALLALGLALAGLRARRLVRQRRRLVEDVGLLQSALLPQLGDHVGPAAVSAAYRPAEGLAAGGDFYDAFALDEHRACVILGDVAGHGRDAVPVTASVRYTLRAYLEGGLTPAQAVQMAGRVLGPQLQDRLVTVLAAIYDDRTGLLTFASAGHPPPVVLGDDTTPVLTFASPALGAGVPTGRRQVTVPLVPGSVACLFTDGLADVVAGDHRLGFAPVADAVRALPPGASAQELLSTLLKSSDKQPDDMAAVLLRPPADAPAPRTGRIEELEVDATDLRRGRLRRFLDELGVSEGCADAATRSATDMIAAAGVALLAVHYGEGGATVAVEETPRVLALHVRGEADPGEPRPAAATGA
jgi:hypothetical protein